MGKLKLVIKNENQPIKAYIDAEFVGNITYYAAVKYGLKDDMDIEEDRLVYIINDASAEFALNDIVKLAKNGYVPEQKAKKKLIDQGYTLDIVEGALSKAKEYNYINDYELALGYIKYKINSQSRRKIIDYLAHVPIARTIAAEIFNNNDEYIEMELEGAVYRIKRIIGDEDEITYKLREKIYRNLSSQGYSSSVINDAVKLVNNDLLEGDDD